VGGAECPPHAAPSTAPGKRAAAGATHGAIPAMSLSAAFLRSAFNSRCTIECCFLQNCSGYLSPNRLTMASAVSCGSAASRCCRASIRARSGPSHCGDCFLVSCASGVSRPFLMAQSIASRLPPSVLRSTGCGERFRPQTPL